MTRTAVASLTALAAALSLTVTACAQESEPEDAETAAAETAPAEDGASTETESAAAPEAPASPAAQAIAAAPDEAWRTVDPDDLLVITTSHGDVWVEFAPEFAPNHVERMRTLVEQDFYDFKVWHRVIDDFMAQGGGALDNPNAAPDMPTLEAEFTIRRGPEMEISELQDRTINPRSNPAEAKAGFWNGFPAGTQPVAQAAIRADGQVESWLLHCEGAAAMARTSEPNSARGQFYITRSDAEHLNSIYTVWGRVRHGQEAINSLAVGTLGQDMGFRPDFIEDMVIASDLPEDERVTIEVMDTTSDAFAAYLDAVAQQNDGELPDVCAIDIPTRITE
ncbi:peptidylprolyl isomerase [Marinicauda salina]|uniref:peptidylprolyl isomerase n=1 Tax=Marinicauda salina TaxID=2135793 RepID=A0A2U2BRK4_9PROT|nr:peptidylprolyl isomerase [Marinicauda salina]PWE16625.1 peptidylprolyl isomerase [Marinicauda salina]